jgi:hypothetical protein
MRESWKDADEVVGSSSSAVAQLGALPGDTDDEGDDVDLDLLEEAEGTSCYEPKSWSELLDYVQVECSRDKKADNGGEGRTTFLKT